MRKIIIGIMGPGANASDVDVHYAYELGNLVARQGWILLTGGRNVGVMAAASRGAKSVGGLTIGILPDQKTESVSEFVDIAIFTDLGNGRNNINVLSSDVVIACGMGAGTASEIALAVKNQKKVLLLTEDQSAKAFFTSLSPENVFLTNSPSHAVKLVAEMVR